MLLSALLSSAGCFGGPCTRSESIAVTGPITTIAPERAARLVNGESCDRVVVDWAAVSGMLRFGGPFSFSATPSCLQFYGLAIGSQLRGTRTEILTGTCPGVSMTVSDGAGECERECATGVRTTPTSADAGDRDATDAGDTDARSTDAGAMDASSSD